ncbi:MAG: hypothetical protein FWF50_04575 [Defluviitaleaceae bacterium]|nr:hypothetical protein [Defluviitaleaceae bacterium]
MTKRNAIKKLSVSILASFMILGTMPLNASATEVQEYKYSTNNKYTTELVIVEVVEIATGEIVSREYLEVELSNEEFKNLEFSEDRILPRNTVQTRYISAAGGNTLLASRSSQLGFSRTTSVAFVSGTLSGVNASMTTMNVSARTATLGTELGSAVIRFGQEARFTISSETLGYRIYGNTGSIVSGEARFIIR